MNEPKKEPTLLDRCRVVIEELVRIRDELSLSDNAFARDYLPYDESAWNRIKNGKYPISERMLKKLEIKLRNLREVLANRRRVSSNARPFYLQDNQKLVIDEVSALLGQPSQNRCIFYLADTGGGKTALTQELMRRFSTIYVEADESWRTSYFAPCADIAKAAGAVGPWRAKYDVKGAMLTKLLDGGPYVLIIDEGNYFGPQAISALKLILNRTNAVIVIVGMVSVYTKLMSQTKTWEEAKQLVRRARLVVRNNKIQPPDLAPFLNGFDLGAHQKIVCAQLARAANEMGMYDLVWRVVDELRAQGEEVVTPDVMTKAIESVRQDMGLGGAL